MRQHATDDFYERINVVLEYIYDNLAADLSLEELSRIACFSRFHFHRIFRAFTSESILAYINRIRLERAAFLLAYRSRKRVTDIAADVGFESPEHFSRLFRRNFGKSPSRYRQQKFTQKSKID